MREYKKDESECGALWEKTNTRGVYMTGTINGMPVVVFKNERKTGKQPDWRILKAKPKTTTAPPEDDWS